MGFFGMVIKVLVQVFGGVLFGSPRDFEDFWSPPPHFNHPWHQCAAGGHFHVPIYYNLDWEGIQKLVDEKRIFLPDSNIHGGMYKIDAL